MPAPDLSNANWRKSSKSNAEGDCVEVAHVEGVIAFRDSKDSAGPALVFPGGGVFAFLASVKNGEFAR